MSSASPPKGSPAKALPPVPQEEDINRQDSEPLRQDSSYSSYDSSGISSDRNNNPFDVVDDDRRVVARPLEHADAQEMHLVQRVPSPQPSQSSSVSITAKKPKGPEMPSGCAVPLCLIFVIGALLAVGATIGVGAFLYQFASKTVEDTVFSKGRSEIDALRARVRPEIDAMDQYLDEAEIAIRTALASHGRITSFASAERILNSSVVSSIAPRIQQRSGLAGMGMLAVLPDGMEVMDSTHAWYVSMYYEPLRDGTRRYTYESMIDDGNWTSREARELNFDQYGVPSIGHEQLWSEENYHRDYIAAETLLNFTVRRQILPWASSFDGFPYWWMENFEYFKVDGMWFSVFCFQYLTRLQTLILEALDERSFNGTSADIGAEVVREFASDIFIYEPVQQAIVSTSYEPEANRTAKCYRSLEDWYAAEDLECIARRPQDSTFPFIRELFAAVERPDWGNISLAVPSEALRVTIDGKEYFVVTQLLVNKGLQRLFVIWTRPAELELREMRSDVVRVVVVCSIVIGATTIVSLILIFVGVLHPLNLITEDMDALAHLQTRKFLDQKKSFSNFKEIRELEVHFQHMAQALHSFALYVPRDVVEELLFHPDKACLGMEKRKLAVLFVDIANFTGLCERFDRDRQTLSKILTHFFRQATHILLRNGSTIDKFIGDAVMAFWGAPLAIDEPCTRTICAGIELLGLGPRITSEFAHDDINFCLRIGASYGDCLCGNTGSEARMNYTALGDVVNSAARLETLNKDYGSSFLVSRELLEGTDRAADILYRSLCPIQARGRNAPIDAFEVFTFTKKNRKERVRGRGLEKLSVEEHVEDLDEAGLLAAAAADAGQQPGDVFYTETEAQKIEMEELYKRREGLVLPQKAVEAILRDIVPSDRLITACTHNNQAVIAQHTGDDRTAREHYQRATELLTSELRSARAMQPQLKIQIRLFNEHLRQAIADCYRRLDIPNPASMTESETGSLLQPNTPSSVTGSSRSDRTAAWTGS